MLGRAIGVSLGVLFVAAVVTYGVFGANVARWGCPSQEELSRSRSVEEVSDAFAEADHLPLERVPRPRGFPGNAPAYRGAVLLRLRKPRATLFVLVCRGRCAISRYQFALEGTDSQRFRAGYIPGNNVAAWVTDDGPRSSVALRTRQTAALSRIDTGVDPDSRCYVN